MFCPHQLCVCLCFCSLPMHMSNPTLCLLSLSIARLIASWMTMKYDIINTLFSIMLESDFRSLRAIGTSHFGIQQLLKSRSIISNLNYVDLLVWYFCFLHDDFFYWRESLLDSLDHKKLKLWEHWKHHFWSQADDLQAKVRSERRLLASSKACQCLVCWPSE